jgi:UDP-N-acetylglucosamine diphosphorylase/glucosamine-1-phosphate N-acetyltransferase
VIFIYEDEQWRNLLPLVHLRPVFDLRCGRRTLLEKFQALYPREKLGLLVRPELAPLTREQHPAAQVEPLDSAICNLQSVICNRPSRTPDPRPPTPSLFLSGRAILDKPLPVQGPEEVFVNGNEIVGFRVNPARLRSSSHKPQATKERKSASHKSASRTCELAHLLACALHLPERKVLASIVKFPWNLIEFNEPELALELREATGDKRQGKGEIPGTAPGFAERNRDGPGFRPVRSATIIGNPRNLRIARNAQIDPGVVFDLRLGRILIDEQAQVRSRSVVAGPCYVGPGTVLDAALVRPGCSFGPDCRIGGEVEASIFLGHANKHHEGFIGHAIVGEWVNLGALTTNSDLRNDYGEVKVMLWSKKPRNQGTKEPRRELRNTGLRKFGCIIADHAKTAIGSLLNTGAVLGIFANWLEPGLSPKLVPDFAGSRRVERSKSQKVEKSKGPETFRLLDFQTSGPLDELLATARTVMSRRGVRLSPEYERLVRRIYAQKNSEV